MSQDITAFAREDEDTGLFPTFCPYGCMVDDDATCPHGCRAMHKVIESQEQR